MTLDELLAKQEIYELSCNYMRGLDRLDAELMHTVFHDDATVDYGFFQGSGKDFVAFAQNALKDHLANHHMIGQVNIKVDGNQAVGEVYFQAFHKVVQDGEQQNLFISGRYVDRYERRDGVWKISFRSEVNDWARLEADADTYLEGSGCLIGARKPDDYSYGKFASR
ncbi:MAG: nuclear transport factor 2 family protein [Gammaproteobacteria bacterium]|nr:nuclear transport factor 2 family protein [Gammaproteobacteria bacterium]